MSANKVKMRPLQLGPSSKTDVRTQFGALCYRVKDRKVQILMVTSRGTKRWILPKGWPIDGATPAQAALREAWEEAGAEGRVTGSCLGIYFYHKWNSPDVQLPCVVAMFPIRVSRLADAFPEAGERKRKWFSQKRAAALVSEPELRHMLRSFDPERLVG